MNPCSYLFDFSNVTNELTEVNNISIKFRNFHSASYPKKNVLLCNKKRNVNLIFFVCLLPPVFCCATAIRFIIRYIVASTSYSLMLPTRLVKKETTNTNNNLILFFENKIKKTEKCQAFPRRKKKFNFRRNMTCSRTGIFNNNNNNTCVKYNKNRV